MWGDYIRGHEGVNYKTKRDRLGDLETIRLQGFLPVLLWASKDVSRLPDIERVSMPKVNRPQLREVYHGR